jgi:hypothetical protein
MMLFVGNRSLLPHQQSHCNTKGLLADSNDRSLLSTVVEVGAELRLEG